MRPLTRSLMLTVLVGALCSASAASAPPALSHSEADSLVRLGQQALEGGDTDRATDLFSKVLEVDRRHAPARCGLGYVYLKRKDIKRARDAFREAQMYNRKSPEAYNGLGLVYAAEKGQWARAIEYFCLALGAKPDYVEAQYNIGMTHLKLMNRDAIKAFRKVVEMAPEHPDAYFRLGYLHELDLLKPDEAAVYYEKQLTVNPGHREAMWRLGRIYKGQSRTNEAARTLIQLMRSEGTQQRAYMLELSEVYLQAGDFEKAETLFETYLADLPAAEREPYEDVSPIAREEELETYRKTSGEARRAFVKRFWKRRDPTPITEVNERRVEHYRRVAYALEHYGGGVQPWDRRGEVYVCYGEPDHRSRSTARQMEADPRVRAVKERLLVRADWAAEDLRNDYAAAHPDSEATILRRAMEERERRQAARQAESLRLRPEGPGLREEVQRKAEADMASGGILPFLGRPIFPIVDRMAWEYWIYAGVAGGIEIVFTQVLGGPEGAFDYAVLPAEMSGKKRRLWEPLQPEAVRRRATSQALDAYVPTSPGRPLHFAACSATFRGRGDSTRVEVYYGFPASEMTAKGEGVRLQRGAVLCNASGDPVYRAVGRTVYRIDPEVGAGEIPDAVALDVSPGSYYLAVQAVEEKTRRTQVYGMPLTVPSYGGEGLRLSDVELAASIEPDVSEGAFVKHHLRVIPLATRFYSRQRNVFIYYEVYGLKKDELGQTGHRVDYTMRPNENRSFGASVLGGLGRLLSVERRQGEVTITYDQAGTSESQVGYLAVDMAGSDPGEYQIAVTVTDLHSGQRASKTAEFKVE